MFPDIFIITKHKKILNNSLCTQRCRHGFKATQYNKKIFSCYKIYQYVKRYSLVYNFILSRGFHQKLNFIQNYKYLPQIHTNERGLCPNIRKSVQ